MGPKNPASGPNSLSPLDWLMPSSYVSQVICFPAPINTSANPDALFAALQAGLRATCAELPYLLAGVEQQARPVGAVQLTAPYQSPDDVLTRQDLRSSASSSSSPARPQQPDYPSLRAAGFPPEALGAIPGLRPRGTTPPFATPGPVFRARASLLDGGVLLCVAFHHKTADITGFGALLKLWAACCRTGRPVAAGFDAGWCDRDALTRAPRAGSGPPGAGSAPDAATTAGPRPRADPDLAGSDQVPDLLHVLDLNGGSPGASAVSRAPGLPAAVPEVATRIFFFPAEGLATLKVEVNGCLSSSSAATATAISNTNQEEQSKIEDDGQVKWVSTGDIITALLWSAVTWAEQRVEVPRDDAESSPACTAAIPVNFRARYSPPLPRDYLGAAFGMAMATAARADLLAASAGPPLPPPDNNKDNNSSDTTAAPTTAASEAAATLARLAAAVRAAVARVTERRVRAALAYTAARDDIRGLALNRPSRTVSAGARGPAARTSVSLVSWADQGVHALDWGGRVGRCDAVRLPRLAAKRYPIVLPRVLPDGGGGGGGGLEVVVAFDGETMERFAQSRLVRKYGRLRC